MLLGSGVSWSCNAMRTLFLWTGWAGALAGCWITTHAAENDGFFAEAEFFGRAGNGRVVQRVTLRNPAGMEVRLINYGAAITAIRVPDRNGHWTNVVLGADTLAPYLTGRAPAGAVIGRFANRIAHARFLLDGREYRLAANNGPHHIHGGRRNFAKRVWDVELPPPSERQAAARFTLHSPDGEEGYPGNLVVTVTYVLTADNTLCLRYRATTDRPTIINLTNHAYFNLAGGGDILNHVLWLAAEQYTPTDAQLIPTGEIRSVAGTPLDFRRPARIGERIAELRPGLKGYDHNFVLGPETAAPRRVARLSDPASGRFMEVWTTQPGVQLYTGNHLRHRGVCLETQHFPDSPHHPQFPSTVLRPGAPWSSETRFHFGARRRCLREGAGATSNRPTFAP